MKSVRKNSAARQPKVAPVLFDLIYVTEGFYCLIEEGLPVDEAVASLRIYSEQSLKDDAWTPLMIPSDVPIGDDLQPNLDTDLRQVDIDRKHKILCQTVKELKEEGAMTARLLTSYNSLYRAS